MVANSGHQTRPLYQLQAKGLKGSQVELSVWELPSPATPRLRRPEWVASLAGKPLSVVEVRLLRKLKQIGIRVAGLDKGEVASFDLSEEDALHLALLFRTLAPMHSIDRIRIVCEGIDHLSKEEAGYWLGMAVHRKNPRRVLAALRVLLSAC
jgi:hypothetical protein